MKVEYYDSGKNQTIKNDYATKASEEEELQREGSRTSVLGRRPNIDEISKRNEAVAKQERKSSVIKNISVTEKDNCYKCYNLMKEHNLNYLPVKNKDNIIGILSRYDVQVQLLHHISEEDEENKIHQDLSSISY